MYPSLKAHLLTSVSTLDGNQAFYIHIQFTVIYIWRCRKVCIINKVFYCKKQFLAIQALYLVYIPNGLRIRKHWNPCLHLLHLHGWLDTGCHGHVK